MVEHAIKLSQQMLPLYKGTQLMTWHVDSTLSEHNYPMGIVEQNPNDNRLFGIRNISTYTWRVTLTDGTQRNVPNVYYVNFRIVR